MLILNKHSSTINMYAPEFKNSGGTLRAPANVISDLASPRGTEYVLEQKEKAEIIFPTLFSFLLVLVYFYLFQSFLLLAYMNAY